jgi:hypothetical protein
MLDRHYTDLDEADVMEVAKAVHLTPPAGGSGG